MPDCVICLGKRKRNEVTTSECKHKFHRRCLAEWSARDRNDCPLCRTPTVHQTIVNSLSKRMDELENALYVLNDQLDNDVSWQTIRRQFPMYRLRQQEIKRYIHNNSLLMTILWILLFQGNQYKALKDAFIDALSKYKRLVIEVTNANLPVHMSTSVPRLKQLQKTYLFFKESYPAWFLFDPKPPSVLNDAVFQPDTSFMKRIIKTMALHHIKSPKAYDAYVKYLTDVRKFYKKKSMVR
jgi:hypothetical protein